MDRKIISASCVEVFDGEWQQNGLVSASVQPGDLGLQAFCGN